MRYPLLLLNLTTVCVKRLRIVISSSDTVTAVTVAVLAAGGFFPVLRSMGNRPNSFVNILLLHVVFVSLKLWVVFFEFPAVSPWSLLWSQVFLPAFFIILFYN